MAGRRDDSALLGRMPKAADVVRMTAPAACGDGRADVTPRIMDAQVIDPVEERRATQKRLVTLSMSVETHAAFKTWCALHGKRMGATIEKAMVEYMNRHR